MFTKAKEILKDYYGYDSFREGQEKIIKNILQEKDTLGIMPTGGGKSICYQVPALLFSGITVVISPLISLMKDQVDALREIDVKAVFINSSQSAAEEKKSFLQITNKEVKIVYVAPERLKSENFISVLNKTEVSMIAVDEAHCVSHWGHDFRPSYLDIAEFVDKLRNRPIISAFTATATKEVSEDIVKNLKMKKSETFISGFDRPNLYFSVLREGDKKDFIYEYIQKNKDRAGIVYASTRKDVDAIYNYFIENGLDAGKYHAGLSDLERKDFQDKFLNDDLNILVATNAFGMGIDKSNVRYVIHYNMPKNMESYYQEAGRAGRDGEDSECILMYSPQDVNIQRFFIEQSEMSDERKKNEYAKLQAMKDYCHTSNCLRGYILEYFGENEHKDKCGKCGSCNDKTEYKDISLEARKILSCIGRMKERYGIAMIIGVLRGSRDKRIIEFGLDKLSTYGIMSEYSKNTVREMINFLIADGVLEVTEEMYSIVKFTNSSAEVLKGNQNVMQRIIIREEKKKSKEIDFVLFEILKKVRKKFAEREKVPPYVIFHDSVLNDMSIYKPLNREELLNIKGVGRAKSDRFGNEFLSVIKDYCGKNPEKLKEREIQKKSLPKADTKNNGEAYSYLTSYALFIEGKSLKEIAEYREVKEITVQDHIIKAAIEGKVIDWNTVFSDKEEQLILEKVEIVGFEKLKPIKELLPEYIDYFKIKAVLCKNGLIN